MFHEIVRIAKAIKPTWGLFENVPGLFSSHGGRDMAAVLEGLRQCWPVVGYCVLDSQYFGVPQRRRRVFFVGGPTESGVEQVLFESEGGIGDSPPSEETRQTVAASLRSRSQKPGINPPGRGGEDDMNLICEPLTSSPSRGDAIGEERKLIVRAFQPQASSTQSMNLLALTPAMGTTKKIGIVGAITNLGGGGPDDNEAQGGHLIAQPVRSNPYNNSDPAMEASMHVQSDLGVRRLTPTECERLQGFPDGWTCLCNSLERYDPNRCTCPDGPRYKALGNAVTVPVIMWLGQQLLAAQEGR